MSSLTTKNKHLTTTQAAQCFNVTRFTVLNWVKQGKLKAVRTLGGHQRIPREVVTSLMKEIKLPPPPRFSEVKPKDKEPFICCWESIEIIESGQHDCARCLVFKQKANRCFLSIREFATMKVECESNCLDCGYFARYFPEEKMAMDGLCSHTVSKSKMNT